MEFYLNLALTVVSIALIAIILIQGRGAGLGGLGGGGDMGGSSFHVRRAIERLLRTPLQKAEDPPGYTSPKAAPAPPSAPGKNVARKPRRPSNRSRRRTQPGTGSAVLSLASQR